MDSSVHVVVVPLKVLGFTLGGVLLLILAPFLLRRVVRSRQSSKPSEEERNWGIPTIDAQAHLRSPFHSWDPRIKIVSLLFFIFCTAALNHILWACIAILTATLSIFVARIPLRYPLRRLAAMGTFLGMFLVVMPLTVNARSGDLLVRFEHLSFLSFNDRGFMLALLICLKASAIALLVEPLLSTSPFPVTIQALVRLRVPQMVCQMILLAHRYIFVFQHETSRMNKGMHMRGFRRRTDMETLRNIANFLGMLLVRSFERTQRVYEAMIARGYMGQLSVTHEFRAMKGDWWKGLFWLSAGIGLVLVDRFWVPTALTAVFEF
jgi:cobalt/nickel transport system permease protein